MALAAVSLDDKYTLDSGRVFLTGTQALVRLPMMQRQRDVAAGQVEMLGRGPMKAGHRARHERIDAPDRRLSLVCCVIAFS